MNDEVARMLIALNQRFYERFAAPFDHSREGYQPGFETALPHLPAGSLVVLDVGCGNGRFGRFLAEHGRLAAYTGIDFSPSLLAAAAENLAASDLPAPPVLIQADLSDPAGIDARQTGTAPEPPSYDLIVCLSTLQHIPQEARRTALIRRLAGWLRPAGRLLLGNWQFLASERQRRKILPWSAAGLSADQVDPEDYLLSWQRGGRGFRYACLIDEAATARLAHEAGLTILHTFRADGREGDLNLYTVLGTKNWERGTQA